MPSLVNFGSTYSSPFILDLFRFSQFFQSEPFASIKKSNTTSCFFNSSSYSSMQNLFLAGSGNGLTKGPHQGALFRYFLSFLLNSSNNWYSNPFLSSASLSSFTMKSSYSSSLYPWLLSLFQSLLSSLNSTPTVDLPHLGGSTLYKSFRLGLLGSSSCSDPFLLLLHIQNRPLTIATPLLQWSRVKSFFLSLFLPYLHLSPYWGMYMLSHLVEKGRQCLCGPYQLDAGLYNCKAVA
ncbi:hypothetical protein F8M41_014199 [Gigaspora margarita]|uniref:Uncharacterized protein n=1 Tax=Gigaspora margarita TaxID=4874 RepID=A0A8H4EV18_GIGMA|nr:hypothetical protein F8M41_014199 [Gigaspora margarita]